MGHLSRPIFDEDFKSDVLLNRRVLEKYPPAWRRTAYGRAGRQSSAAASPRAKKPLRGFFAKPLDGRSAGSFILKLLLSFA